MDVSKRQWWLRLGDEQLGPLSEDDFQERLRNGEFALEAEVKSSMMDGWKPLLAIVAEDESFRRPSTMPPPMPKPNKE